MQHCESRADGRTPWRHREVQQSRRLTWSAGLPTPVLLQLHARLSSSSPGAPAELWALLSPSSSLCSGHGLHVSSIAGESGARAARQNRSLRTLNGSSGRIAGRSDKIWQSVTGNERASRADRPRAQLRRGEYGASACHTKVGKFDWTQARELLSGYMYGPGAARVCCCSPSPTPRLQTLYTKPTHCSSPVNTVPS
jgi:hypothetical protein